MKKYLSLFETTFRPNSKYRPFFLSLLLMSLGYGIYKGIIDNYLAEIISMTQFDRGLAEFFREIPGMLLIVILAALYTLSAERLYKFGALICLIGMAMHAAVPATRVWVTIAICIYSAGEHIQLAMCSTISLNYAKEAQGGAALGLQSSVKQVGTLIGYAIIIVAFLFVSGVSAFRSFFWVASVLTGAALLVSMRLTDRNYVEQPHNRFYFRKKYTKYYCLELFYGARKQVFLTFGPYVLILFYGASTVVISALFAISAICCFFASPIVGKIIDRLGYKIVMISDTLILVVVCFFYGFAHHLFPMKVAFVICCANYVLDSVISLASMASNIYVQELSDTQEEMKATSSTGLSVNHMITILIALFGGWIWTALGIEALFALSAVLGLCNSAYAASIKPKKRLGE